MKETASNTLKWIGNFQVEKLKFWQDLYCCYYGVGWLEHNAYHIKIFYVLNESFSSVLEMYQVLTLASWVNLIDRQWFPVYLLHGSVTTCCEDYNWKKKMFGVNQNEMLSKLGQNTDFPIFTADDLGFISE